MRRKLLALAGALAALVISVLIAACGDDKVKTSELGLITDGQLLVGTDTPFEPFEIGQPPDITGYDIDVINAVADKLGLEVTYQDTGFDTFFRDVAQGQFDIGAAASTIQPDRAKVVDFSDPYYASQQALLVPAGSDIAGVDDLAGKTVGTQDATTGETFANNETDAAEVRGFPEGPDAIAALQTGQVDAVVIDEPVAAFAASKQEGIEIVIVEQIPRGNELFGFPFAPANDALREAFNDALQGLKDDGTIAKLYQKWFTADPPASVLEGTTEPTA